MTLNNLERRNSPYFAFFTEFDRFQADYITVVEDRPIMSVQYCLPVPVFYFGENCNAPCSTVSLR